MRALQISPGDGVATVIEPVAAGEAVSVGDRTLVAAEPIPRGHKIALADIAAGADVIKYGVPIGHATQPIAAGQNDVRRTIGSSANERPFQASQSVFTLRHTRLTVSLPTAPPNKAASARCTRRVLVPAR